MASCLGLIFHGVVHFCCSFIRWFKLFSIWFVCVCVCVGGGGGFELLVQGLVWHPLHLFCLDEKVGLSSALKWFNSSRFFFHFRYGSGFHGTEDCPQADVLNFVQFTGVRLGCCCPGAGPIFQR